MNNNETIESLNKTKKSKIILTLIIISIIIVVFIVGFKVAEYFIWNQEITRYSENEKALDNLRKFKNESIVTINHKGINKNEDYLVLNDFKIRKDFQDSEIYSQSENMILVRNVSNNITNYGMHIEEPTPSLVASFLSINKNEYKENGISRFNWNIFEILNSYNFKNEIKREKIDNDLEMMKYLYKCVNNNTITRFIQTKKIASCYMYSLFIYDESEKIYSIDGDYSGMIYKKNDNQYKVVLTTNNYNYTFSLFGEDINYGYVIDLISTVVID